MRAPAINFGWLAIFGSAECVKRSSLWGLPTYNS